MKHTLFIIALLTTLNLSAQDSKFDTITIKTTAVCDMCIETIEKGFAFEQGVKSSKVDLDANTVTVVYNNRKTDAETVKKALTEMGYGADEFAPDPKAYNSLHYCCQADLEKYDH